MTPAGVLRSHQDLINYMTGRNVALALAIALAGGFLLGYVPGCMRASDLQTRLNRSDQAASFSAVRDLASMLHVEIANRNFGNAADLSARLFEQVRALAAQSDGTTRDGLHQILAQRDAISSGLAKNDPAIEPQVRAVVQQLHHLSPAAKPGR